MLYFKDNFTGTWEIGTYKVDSVSDEPLVLLEEASENVNLTLKGGVLSSVCYDFAIAVFTGNLTLENVTLNASGRYAIVCMGGKTTMTGVNTAIVEAVDSGNVPEPEETAALGAFGTAAVTIHSGTFTNAYEEGYTYISMPSGETAEGKTLASCIPGTSISVPANSTEIASEEGYSFQICEAPREPPAQEATHRERQ